MAYSNNETINQAWETMHDPDSGHIFLTGNAGTGKSTLIRDFIRNNAGEVIVLAPTGIAAVNIGGITIHRFGSFPIIPVNFDSVKWLDPRKDFVRIEVIKRAKYLVVDEISMVRADLMDQLEWFLRKNFPKLPPFAGLKLIMVGDIDQLPPVMADEGQKKMIRTRYKSEFFFHAKCWQDNWFQTITLTHIFRQSDPVFVKLLNDIKNNRLAPFDLQKLNDTCLVASDRQLTPKDGVMLCATNAIVREVNAAMLDRLETETVELEGQIIGDFNSKNCPVEPTIYLKEGARVMLMRNCNDPGNEYFNGSIGEFIGFEDYIVPPENQGEEETIIKCLKVKLDTGAERFVGKANFQSIDYIYDEAADKIQHKVTGEFIQYPIKIAYALSIHKSQGQTFSKVIIDLGEHGAFEHGQTYVALSRCTSMEGLILQRPIRNKDLIYSQSVLDFHKYGIPQGNPEQFIIDEDDLPF